MTELKGQAGNFATDSIFAVLNVCKSGLILKLQPKQHRRVMTSTHLMLEIWISKAGLVLLNWPFAVAVLNRKCHHQK